MTAFDRLSRPYFRFDSCETTGEVIGEDYVFCDRVRQTGGRIWSDILTFQGRTLDELRAAFADTIADYLDWCRERGKEPERPYSGNFTVRLPPDLHRRIATAAARRGKSVNAFVTETLERAA